MGKMGKGSSQRWRRSRLGVGLEHCETSKQPTARLQRTVSQPPHTHPSLQNKQ